MDEKNTNKERLHLFLARLWAEELHKESLGSSGTMTFEADALLSFLEPLDLVGAGLYRGVVLAGCRARLWDQLADGLNVYSATCRLRPVRTSDHPVDDLLRLVGEAILGEAIEFEPALDPFSRHRWYLEQIAEALGLTLAEHEPGVAPVGPPGVTP